MFRPERERLLGSARLWRAGCGILPQRTFPYHQLNSLQSNITKVRDGRMPSPARYKRALPRNRLRNKVPLASVNLTRNV